MPLINVADADLSKLKSSNISYSSESSATASSSKTKKSKDYDPANPFNFKGIDFPKLEAAPYEFIDPMDYAKKFGNFNTDAFSRNFETSEGFALDTLETELQGLQAFVPAAAALKRETTSADNLFNTEQRRRAVESVLPGAKAEFAAQRETLAKQGRRADAYAEGRLPDEQMDRALELNIRSSAADQAGFSGIGPRSMQASKVSDLMSVEERFKISQYGESLIDQNINARTNNINAEGNVFLAPTQYSEAGSEVRATPEVGAGQLRRAYTGDINQQTLINPTDALNTSVNQQQFKTNLNQRVTEFNTNTQLDLAKTRLQLKLAKSGGGGGGGGGGGASAQTMFDRDFQTLAAGYQAGLQQQGMADRQDAGTTNSIASYVPAAASFVADIYNSVVGDSDE